MELYTWSAIFTSKKTDYLSVLDNYEKLLGGEHQTSQNLR